MEAINSKNIKDNSTEVINTKNQFKENNFQGQKNMPFYESVNLVKLQKRIGLNNFDNTISTDNKNNEYTKNNSFSLVPNNNISNVSSSSFSDIKSNGKQNTNHLGMNNNNPEQISDQSIENINSMSDITSEIFQMNEECLICSNILTQEEVNNNFIGCFHGFCDGCFCDYFKEKINSNIIEIKCPEKNCNNMIPNYFIEEKLIKDIPLLSKYKNLIVKRQLQLDPNVKFCPYPNCDSYAIKKDTNSVSCIHNGHKFCFNCLNYWHDKGKCTIDIYNFYKKWKTSKKIKRCPRCKYLIEKNEGCNHITCFNCKYEWCWICKNEYKPGHYGFGSRCFGLQYASDCCTSNKFCSILRTIGIFLRNYFLIPLVYIIFYPLYIFLTFQKKIFNRYVTLYIYSKKVSFFFYLEGIAQYIRLWLYIYLFLFCTLIGLVFICPLRHKIIYFLKNY